MKARQIALLVAGSLLLAGSLAQGGRTSVRGYYRKDGTYVRPYTRSTPGSGGYSSTPSYSPAPLFRNCAEARAAGYSNMGIGSSGYSSGLDGDGDGIACEAGSGGSGGSTPQNPSTPQASPNALGLAQSQYLRPVQGAVPGATYLSVRAFRDDSINPTLNRVSSSGGWINIHVPGHDLRVKAGTRQAYSDGKAATLTAAPFVLGGRTYMPLWAIQKLGCGAEGSGGVLTLDCPSPQGVPGNMIVTSDFVRW